MESRWSRLADHDTDLHWVERGEGRPLVLLHGIADSHRTWLPFARSFPNRRVIALDLPGHGLSGRPDAPYTPEWYAQVLGSWWDQLGLEDVDLVGHSYGGALAQTLMLTHRERVSSLTLIAPGGHGCEVGWGLRLLGLPGAEQVIGPFIGIGTEIALRAIPGKALTSEEIAMSRWTGSRPGTARAMVRTARAVIDFGGQTRLVHERAQDFDALPPTAMLWGSCDPILPMHHADGATRWLTNMDVRFYEGCGHWPHVEEAGRVGSDVRALLESTERRRISVSVGAVPKRTEPWIRRVGRAVVRGLEWLMRPQVPARAE
ncbi:MAG: alpha/beta fold hydrolase [Myxococcota bacterium]|nr:alpha/beta fold hydrolase [Myxococcota bacterium]